MKLAIILGGSKGLGQFICEQYLQQGWQVCEYSRSAPHSYSVSCDLSQVQESRKLIQKQFQTWAEQDWQEIHLIHNAARLGKIGPVHKAELEDSLQTVALNFNSLVMVTEAFAQIFAEHSAPKFLAAVSSGAAQKNYPGWSLYCATKAAMERYMGVFAVEQAELEQGIHALVINPGVMDTEMQAQIRTANPADFPNLPRFLKLKADNALPSPESVAEIIVNQIMQKAPENGGVYRVADYQ